MFSKIKSNIAYYQTYYKHGVMTYILITIFRILLFPIALIKKLWEWVYEID